MARTSSKMGRNVSFLSKIHTFGHTFDPFFKTVKPEKPPRHPILWNRVFWSGNFGFLRFEKGVSKMTKNRKNRKTPRHHILWNRIFWSGISGFYVFSICKMGHFSTKSDPFLTRNQEPVTPEVGQKWPKYEKSTYFWCNLKNTRFLIKTLIAINYA